MYNHARPRLGLREAPARRIVVALAAAALVVALLWSPVCPVMFARGQRVAGNVGSFEEVTIADVIGKDWLLTGISTPEAQKLGLVDGTVTTVTGDVVDMSSKLSAPTQCSGRLCVDLQQYAADHPELADINARVLLWRPKLVGTIAGNLYDPSTKDWASVIATCRAMFEHEKRLASFFIRASFHDSMAVDVSQCPGPNCGGADCSLLLTIDEMTRPENAYDDFSLLTSRAAKKIASFFDISVADTLAVGQLPEVSAGVGDFVHFWNARGITTQEAMALMGSHALIDNQGCFQGPTRSKVCDPTSEDCTNVRMFRWENHYFHDLCSPTLKVTVRTDEPPEPRETPILGMTEPEMEAESRLETCLFTSEEFRTSARNQLRLMQAGLVREPPPDVPENVIIDWSNRNCTAAALFGVPSSTTCPHAPKWLYTPNDAFLGQACQGLGTSAAHASVRTAARAFLHQPSWDETYRTAYIKMVSKFARYSPAAIARPFNISGNECTSGYHLEAACAQSYIGLATQDTKDLYGGLYSTLDKAGLCAWCSKGTCPLDRCYSCVSSFTARLPKIRNALVTGPNCCTCSTALRKFRYDPGSQEVLDLPAVVRYLEVLPATTTTITTTGGDTTGGNIDGTRIVTVDGISTVEQLPKPVLDGATQVDTTYAPPKEYVLYTQQPLKRLPLLEYMRIPDRRLDPIVIDDDNAIPPPLPYILRPGTTICMDAYEIDVYPTTVNMGCPSGLTWILSYNGSSPGPTIRNPVGRQTLIRFNNRMTTPALASTPFSPYTPCDTTPGRQGRPIAVHNHGEASLAPYDGWAEDTTCGGESKDYYYPSRRGGFGWYHDHQLELTSENAYFGLSGMYVVHDSPAEGGCGEPWNLNGIPDTEMQFKDAVLDGNCQLFYDRSGPHRDNLYGDVNLVNGVPWPVMTIRPRWHRFRSGRVYWYTGAVCLHFLQCGPARAILVLCNSVGGGILGASSAARWLNSAVTRPYKLRIVASDGSDVSSRICQVIAGEGGLRRTPARFPAAGLFLGVAERYEVVCDFSSYSGRTFFLMNVKDERRMKSVPFFCHSHLLMKIQVFGIASGPTFQPFVPSRTTLDAVLKEATDIPNALSMVRSRQCTRSFRFGRRHGQWVINGETWHTARVAAGNVGQNTWEIWCLETGGGWFHPIHIHLVDFYVLARNHDESQVHEYERWTSKDVVQLDPSTHVSLLVRFGPHRGEYMFHCHNLIHEDFEMMRSFRVAHTAAGHAGTALSMQSQPGLVTSLNVIYDLYNDPVYPSYGPRSTASLTPLHFTFNPSVQAALSHAINHGIYRIFYPGGSSGENLLLFSATHNPWLVSLPTSSRC
ncbi:hypothetical protein VOLCADRAFT_87571 [Volvox carteri f. nagariensis]|uniref:Plastocyanin-like domain-containing protein n=1 Tax=Volvox carteri f. nagariensis TaxID=3068 RepID=D8TLN3_VOLCA|nr:uncharacterized protein VOLCADRAFT_87571 [Volvox carteri f. nagariensis]EFJ51493.1 hypothetical protein VOLCADRAFT_87571 [Volvox carteri f. nagariensis]|eukprot:XP_002947445.1 hypothetical protein VOLCADRAFT_87571 [Volvox carteri f. nagariensis]